MYINKSDKGYGYYSTIKSKDKNGNEVTAFMNINFKKGTEPESKSIQGELYFIDEFGDKRKAFFNAYKRNDGTVQPGLVLMGVERSRERYSNQEKEQKDSTLVINPEDLPFY